MKHITKIAIIASITFVVCFLIAAKSTKAVDDTQYQFTVIDSKIEVWNNDTYVGTVKLQGQLDSLLVDYNQ